MTGLAQRNLLYCNLLSPPTSEGSALVLARPRFFLDGIGFSSVSEAALGHLLEHFVAGFKLQHGETFQVPIGAGRSVDFKISDVLVEFHNLRFRQEGSKVGDFKDRSEYKDFRRTMRRLRYNPGHRQRFLSTARKKLRQNYFERRRGHINQNPALGRCELVVTTSLEEFHQLVIMRFSTHARPSIHHFRKLFEREVGEIIRAQRAG